MGQTLSSPMQSKTTSSGMNSRYAFAISEMQGWRVSMEDSHTTLLKLNEEAADDEADSFFAVYDGHGGSAVARYAGDNVHRRLANEESYQEKNYEKALRRSFMGTDEDLRADPAFFRDPSGCTAVAALITHDGRIFVANAGDSRSVLCSGGKEKPLSFDHKPYDPVEYNRIKNAGGYVEGGRVCGNLALSRAIGDFEFKKQYSLEPEDQIITSNPDITEHIITEDDEFLILACDGIWDCLSSQQCINYVRRSLQKRKPLTRICEEIMDHCLSPDSGDGIGMDNMTILIVAILHGRALHEWYDWVAERVEQNVGYYTPAELPQVYTAARLLMASERQRRIRENPRGLDDDDDDDRSIHRMGPLGGLARIFAGADVSFVPERGTSISRGTLFRDDSSDEEVDENLQIWDWSNRRPQERFESSGDRTGMIINGEELPDPEQDLDIDYILHGVSENHIQGETPPSPGDTLQDRTPPQLSHLPLGDAPPSVLKLEGALDTSEDPLKSASSA